MQYAVVGGLPWWHACAHTVAVVPATHVPPLVRAAAAVASGRALAALGADVACGPCGPMLMLPHAWPAGQSDGARHAGQPRPRVCPRAGAPAGAQFGVGLDVRAMARAVGQPARALVRTGRMRAQSPGAGVAALPAVGDVRRERTQAPFERQADGTSTVRLRALAVEAELALRARVTALAAVVLVRLQVEAPFGAGGLVRRAGAMLVTAGARAVLPGLAALAPAGDVLALGVRPGGVGPCPQRGAGRSGGCEPADLLQRVTAREPVARQNAREPVQIR